MIKKALIVTGSTALVLTLRSWQLHWGATHREIVQENPGDRLLAWSNLTATRAVSIDARPEQVWPWIAQIGQNRGGFYSFDWLENLFGCQIYSADRIDPRWQHPAVGMKITLHPAVSLEVGALIPGVALVLHGAVPVTGATPSAAAPFDSTWAFILEPNADGNTRLISRERYCYQRPLGQTDRRTGVDDQLHHDQENAARHQDARRGHR